MASILPYIAEPVHMFVCLFACPVGKSETKDSRLRMAEQFVSQRFLVVVAQE